MVIVGSGFGGLAAAKALKRAPVEVVLVDRTNHHLFQPLLYQVATAALSAADVATAVRTILRDQANATMLMAEVLGVDTMRRELRLRDGPALAYDTLILATGADYAFFGHDEWGEHALTLKTLEDALAIRNRLLCAFEAAERTDDPAERERLLTFAVVGGGPTGVEMAGAIAEMARTTLARDFRRFDPRQARVLLLEAAPRLLGAFPERLSAYAVRALEDLGVEVRTGAAVERIDADGLVVGGQRIAASAVLWCAGVKARPAAAWLQAPAARNGGVVVGPDCAVEGRRDTFVIGDVASHVEDGRPLPGLAPVAKQQGRYVARVIRARLDGATPPGPFRYRDWGSMAVIGRSRAVALLRGLRLKGYLAWLAWSLVHLMLLVDFRSRISVYLTWTWAWFTYGRSARIVTRDGR